MYRSLLDTGAKFHLYIYAFDDACHEYFTKAAHEHITVISLHEFEDEKLLAVKEGRTATEYCWTCTPLIIRHCIKTFGLDSCTYIDADMYFYADPEVLTAEAGNAPVMITEHRYTKEYDHEVKSGRFCVQFMYFKNEPQGMEVLNWWCNACLDWCYNRLEDGKFGDQKYLDDWPVRFPFVHILEHLGGGVAPWNVQQYRFQHTNAIEGEELSTGKKFPLIFYHYHGVRFYENNVVDLSDYKKPGNTLELLYKPYIKKLLAAGAEINKVMSGIDSHGINGATSYPTAGFGLGVKYYLKDLRRALALIAGRDTGRALKNYPLHKIK